MPVGKRDPYWNNTKKGDGMIKIEVWIKYNEPAHIAGLTDYIVHHFLDGTADGYILGVREMAEHMTATVTLHVDGKERFKLNA